MTSIFDTLYTQGTKVGAKAVAKTAYQSLFFGQEGGYAGVQARSAARKKQKAQEAEGLGELPDDPLALIDALIGNSSAMFLDKVRDGGWKPEYAEELRSLSSVSTARSTPLEKATRAQTALDEYYQSQFSGGLLDGEDLESQLSEYQSLSAKLQTYVDTGVGGALGGAPAVDTEQQFLADYTAQQKRAAELEEMGYYRSGLIDLIQATPAAGRTGVITSFLQDPKLRRLFIPDERNPLVGGGFSGGGTPVASAAAGRGGGNRFRGNQLIDTLKELGVQ